MTWYLDPDQAEPTDTVQPLTGQVPGRFEQFKGAGWGRWARRDDWNLSLGYANDLSAEMTEALGGLEAVRPSTREEQVEFNDGRTRHHYLARKIGSLKANGPQGRFNDLPGTPEEADALIMRRRQTDFDANKAMLERGDSWAAQLAGEMGAAVFEPLSIATIPLGGAAGNLGRFITMEAALGAISETPGVFREQQVAKDLGFTPSDPLTEIAIGAGAQAGLGVVMRGAGRAAEYVMGRRRAEVDARPADIAGRDWEQSIDGAEADLRAGREPTVNLPQRVDSAGIPEGYYTKIRGAESGGNDAAKNPLSSATGRYQFTAGTWRDLMRANPELGLTPDGRLDPGQQERAIRAFTANNADGLRSAGVPVDSGSLYAAHFLGIGDARRVLRAGADTALTDLLSPGVISANPFLKRMTVADFRAWTLRKTGGAGGGDAGAFVSAAGDPIEYPNARRFSEFGEVTTPAGMSVDVRYRVVDLDSLQRASGELQPRDRSRAASDEQIASIARNLDPNRLLPSPESASGAPIIGPGMMVESGNGRIAALNRAAEEHPDRYQSYIRAIEDAGFPIPEGVGRPALVAERVTDLDIDARRRFVRESNTSSIGRMSATEQAGVDADYLSQAAFDGYRPGRGLNNPDNAEFVRRVFGAMPQAERAGLMTAEGRLNIDGLRRLRQALFARAFDADDLLKLLAESEHPAVENLLRMLEDLAPDWAAFRAAVDAGYIRSDFDITDQLMDAVRMIARARIDPRDGQSVIAALRDRMSQGDMFATRDPELTEAIIGVFYKGERARGSEASAEILTRYMSEAEIAGRADIEDMFAAETGLTPTATLREAALAQDARAPMPNRNSVAESSEGRTSEQVDIRAVDGAGFEDGAQSAALTRATDTELRELRESLPDTEPPQLIDAAPRAVEMTRPASSFDEAKAAAAEFRGQELTNTESGITAVVSSTALRKILSGKAVKKSSSLALHSRAVANLDHLFAEAKLGWSKPDRAGSAGIAAIHRLFSAVRLDDGRMGMVKITVKETARPSDQNVLYTIEAVDFQRAPSAAQWIASGAEADGISAKAIRSAEGIANIAIQVDEFNRTHDAIVRARAALDADPGATIRVADGDDLREVSLAQPASSGPSRPCNCIDAIGPAVHGHGGQGVRHEPLIADHNDAAQHHAWPRPQDDARPRADHGKLGAGRGHHGAHFRRDMAARTDRAHEQYRAEAERYVRADQPSEDRRSDGLWQRPGGSGRQELWRPASEPAQLHGKSRRRRRGMGSAARAGHDLYRRARRQIHEPGVVSGELEIARGAG